MSNFPERLLALRKRLKLTQSAMAEKVGLSLSYIHQLEAGKRTPSDAVETLIGMLESQVDAGLIDTDGMEDPPDAVKPKGIPIVSWAHAGASLSGCYEELPKSWQDPVEIDPGDEQAFVLVLRGDSMTREFQDGDMLVVTPSTPLASGSFAVVKLANDGILFRKIEKRAEFMRLIPFNTERYTIEEIPYDQILWAHTVHSAIRILNR